MGIWDTAKRWGSKIYQTAKSVNDKFGDLISAGAAGLMKIPHGVPKAIGAGILGAQALLGDYSKLLNAGTSFVKDKIGVDLNPILGKMGLKTEVNSRLLDKKPETVTPAAPLPPAVPYNPAPAFFR